MPRVSLFVLAFLAVGCSGLGAPASSAAFEVEVSPTRGGAPLRVLRIRARGRAEYPLERDALWLFAGELGDYHVGRVRRGELPSTLVERLVAAEIWADAEGWLTLAPNRPLEAGASYTLAAAGYGALTTFAVSVDDGTPWLERVWPPLGASGMGAIVLCGDDVPSEASSILLEPGGVEARLTPGLGSLSDGRRCVEVRVEAEAEPEASFVLPAEGAGFLLDPATLRAAPLVAVAPTACFPGEVSFGPACGVAADDRLELFPMPEPALWRLPDAEGFLLRPIVANQAFSLRGLSPDSQQQVAGFVSSQSGVASSFDASFRTEPARAHVVLNEVLANPLGPEPSAEWVELVNDSQRAVELAGFSLGDAGGSVTLPEARLEARAYALLVRADHDASASPLDVPIAPGTELVRLPALGAKGLSNAGEALWLRDAQGILVSEFPAVAAPHAGVSVARARPDALVGEPAAFAAHAAPGASPGAANSLSR